MLSRSFFAALALAGVSAGNLLQLLEGAPILPAGWKKVDKTPDPAQRLRLSLALRQPDIDSIRTKIGTKADNSERYLSREEAQALRDPDQQDVDDVLAWLKDNGLAGKATADRDWIHVKATVEEVQDLLDTTIEYFQFEGKEPVLRTQEYSVPDSVFDAISFVHPLANFMRPKKDLTSPDPDMTPDLLSELDVFNILSKRDAACGTVVQPDCLRKLYNINYTTPDNTSSIRLGIAGFLEEYANYQDSDAFLKILAPDLYAKGYNYSVKLLNGGQNSQVLSDSGPEAALDVQYAMGVGYPTQITYYLAGGRGIKLDNNGTQVSTSQSDNEPYLEFVEYLLDMPDDKLPQVLSISYADNEVSVPRLYAERTCALFGLLTARGTTILVASGDGGAKGSSNSNCRTNDGTDQDVAMSVFPATCPWVTSVGGVTNVRDPPEGAEFSGGGFSQYFPREAWQDAAVESYVKQLNGTLDGYYNASFRAVPDISAVASSFVVRQGGEASLLRGTSASTPVVAAMIALINDARVRKGKRVLGWLNEALYSEEVQAVLQDVTKGQSYSCDFSEGGLVGGWPATKGYDAMTGLGVPYDFQKLFDVLVKL